jgi:hypothetical protein
VPWLSVLLRTALFLLQVYGSQAALKWFVYWRLFYLACSELFNYDAGEEWGVGHYLFVKPQQTSSTTGTAAAASSPGNGVVQ